MLRFMILVVFVKVSLFACGFGDEGVDYIFLENRNEPYASVYEKDLDSPSTYNDLRYEYEANVKKANLQSYKKNIFKNLSIDEIEKIVYEGENIDKIRNEEIKEYLKFVQKQEGLVIMYGHGGNANPTKLMNEALKMIHVVQSPWLKLRYFYLGLRLAHYKKLGALKVYEKHKNLLNQTQKSIVKDWIQALYAGALSSDKQYVKSNYEFSKLFTKKAINWYLSYYNFSNIKSDKDWEELLKLAKDNEEKTKFYAIRALKKSANKLEELQNIYKIDKNSKWFDYVLFRVLLESSDYFNSQEENYLYTKEELEEQKKAKQKSYKRFIEFLKDVKKDDMYLTNLALGYFNFYTNDIKSAKTYAQEALKLSNNGHEAMVFDYIVYLNSLEKIDINTQNTIYDKFQILQSQEEELNPIKNYTIRKLIELFSKNNEKFLAYLVKQIEYFDFDYLDLEKYNKLQDFLNNPKKSKLQEYIAKNIDNKEFRDITKIVYQKILINNLKFKDALDINTSYLSEKNEFNPFGAFIKGNNRMGLKDTYTVRQILEKTLEIKNVLKKDPNALMDNYLYGNLLFNLSYFGNSNMLTTTYRSNYSIKDKDFEIKRLKLALKYYENAIKHSDDDEFSASSAYMALKVKLALNELKNTKISDYDGRYEFTEVEDNTKIKALYNEVKNKYSNTDYYDQLIHECYNFKKYTK